MKTLLVIAVLISSFVVTGEVTNVTPGAEERNGKVASPRDDEADPPQNPQVRQIVLEVEISELGADGKPAVLTRPKVATLDGQTATIRSGDLLLNITPTLKFFSVPADE